MVIGRWSILLSINGGLHSCLFSSLYRVLFFMQFEVLFGLVKMDRVSTAKDRVESSAWQSSQMDEAT